ncbi:MAG TPA: hypothetical protein PKH39_18585 [Woeseiaceae bacterium]|nr:hypothetical protein [Woeseiaceae bacterium]
MLTDKEQTWYRADGDLDIWYEEGEPTDRVPWKPSIHMPRKFCRLVLEVKSVRVERLQEISRGDCMSEGCPFPNMQDGPDPKTWFSDLWNSISAKRAPWDSNPWVWVVEFERVESGAGTDQ